VLYPGLTVLETG